MRKFIITVLAASLIIAAVLPARAAAPNAHATQNVKCPKGFECDTVTVPLDHYGKTKTKSDTLDIAYAVLPARESSQRKGVLLVAVGGPGSSGLQEAVPSDYSSNIRDAFDIVFFDPRGIGQSGFLDCPNAYGEHDHGYGLTPEQEKTLISEARTFAEDCVTEMGFDDATKLNFYNTYQVVGDVEAIRAALHEDKIWILGESYGTQVAQQYAALYPEHVAGMVIDGPVNLKLTNFELLNEQVRGYNDLLARTLQNCDRIAACKSDAGSASGGLVAAYDKLIAQLAKDPITIKFPNKNGEVQDLSLTRYRFENEVSWLLDREWGRAALQRAMAAAANGDLVPLGRAFNFTLFPPRRSAMRNITRDEDAPGESNAMFYVVECADDQFFPGSADQKSEAFLRAGDKVDGKPRLSLTFFYDELTCAYWPNTSAGYTRYDPAPAADVPTLIIAAQGDVTTPLAQARTIRSQLPSSKLLTVLGGVHVMHGRTNVCVNNALDQFLIDDKLPKRDETYCEATTARAYMPLAPRDAKTFRNPLEAMDSFDTQMYALPEYLLWNDNSTLAVGCSFGGTLAFDYNSPNETVTLKKCAMSNGFALTGECVYNNDDDRLVCDVRASGSASGNKTGDSQFQYARSGRRMMLTGTYDGKPVTLTQDDVQR